ncbi:MAG: ribosome maturation factor RimM [Gammaproteobacteria bacterium]
MTRQHFIHVGEISGVFGIKGWLKVFSYTEPRENILSYSPWRLCKGTKERYFEVEDGYRHGKNVVVQLAGVDDRDAAEALSGWKIFIERAQLPDTDTGEYYWADLCGLKVVNLESVELGRVDHLMETGANDVLVVKGDRERLIPFVMGQSIVKVDMADGVLIVDWDPDF